MKYLIISHDATRTGAPILLLNLAKLILKNEPNSVSFLLKRGGSLQPDFNNLGPTFYVNQKLVHSVFSRLNKNRKTAIEDIVFLNQFDYIISNTITNGDILDKIRNNYKGKIITYIHELEIASKTYTTPVEISRVMENSNSFWVPSTLVRDFISDSFKIASNRIDIMPYSIHPTSKIKEIESKEFIIGGCGTADWRKGPDLFILTAKKLILKYPDYKIKFRWIGALDEVRLERMKYQIDKADLNTTVTFESAVDDVSEFYNSIDLFLLTSREDPYPLVILEAASYGVPSICFDKVCGSKDFIDASNGGSIVPFLDIDQLVETIIQYHDDEIYRTEKGINASKYLLKTHSNDEYVYDKFKELIKK